MGIIVSLILALSLKTGVITDPNGFTSTQSTSSAKVITDPNGKVITDPNGFVASGTTSSIITDPNGKP